MRKEVIIAIVVGSILGLAVAFGIWRANQALSPRQTPTPTPLSQAQLELLLSEPEDNLVIAEDTVTVAGSFRAGATVAILYNLGEKIIEVGADGTFSESVELEAGANEITVVGFDENGESVEKTLTAVYSTEFEAEQ